jgi:hypothetical protein
MNDAADEGIDGNEAFSLQLAQGHMNSPLILAKASQAIEGEIEALAHAHASVSEKQ